MRSKFFSFIALLAVAGAHAEDFDLEKVVGSLITAEKAYAKLAGEKGFREASILVFADDAVIFGMTSLFRNRSKDQIPQPIRIRDAVAIRSKRFHGRVHTQIAV